MLNPNTHNRLVVGSNPAEPTQSFRQGSLHNILRHQTIRLVSF
jgi:hypothetical protein